MNIIPYRVDAPSMGLYDAYLALRYRHRTEPPPAHVAITLTERDLLDQEAYTSLENTIQWAFDYDAERVTIAVSVLDEAVIPTLKRELQRLETPHPVAVHGPNDTEDTDAPIHIGIGLGGKQEFTKAVRDLSADVADGTLDPDAIDADLISDRLIFPDEPDLLIKTGANRLSDFAIWQSVYSELYFTDVNWRDFRRRDFLRAVLEYQDRQRRFGQ